MFFRQTVLCLGKKLTAKKKKNLQLFSFVASPDMVSEETRKNSSYAIIPWLLWKQVVNQSLHRAHIQAIAPYTNVSLPLPRSLSFPFFLSHFPFLSLPLFLSLSLSLSTVPSVTLYVSFFLSILSPLSLYVFLSLC